MNDEALLEDETVVSNEDVEVSRRLTRKGKGIVGVVEIRSTGRKPVAMVHVVDDFPTDLPVEVVGFNSETEPEAGNITPDGVSIKQTVEDDPVEVQYGVKLSDPVESIEFDPPEIRGVETAEITRSGTSLTDGGRRSSASGDGVDDSSGSLSSIVSILGRRSSEPEREDDRRSSDPGRDRASPDPSRTGGWNMSAEAADAEPDEGESDGSDASDEAIESAVARVDESEDAETETAGAADGDGADGANAPDDPDTSVDPNASNEAIEGAVARIDAPGDTEADPETGTTEPDESSDEPDRPGSETADIDEAEADTDRADTDEAEAGSDADGETGSDAGVGAADEPAPEPSPAAESGFEPASERDGSDDESTPSERRSVEARVDQLTLRVEKFAAYATALEELIDEHGPAEEFIDRTESELAELDEQLRSVRREVESVRSDHGEAFDDLQERTDALDRRIAGARDALEREVGDVRDRVDEEVERIDDDLADQGTDVERIDEEVETLDDRVADVESDLRSVREGVRSVEEDVSSVSEEVRTVREELESLRAEVEAFNDVRRTLADAFDLPAEAEAPADD